MARTLNEREYSVEKKILLASNDIPKTGLIWTYLHYQHRPKPAIGTSDVIQLLCACFFKCRLSDGRYE